jgi:hypothetical protein
VLCIAVLCTLHSERPKPSLPGIVCLNDRWLPCLPAHTSPRSCVHAMPPQPCRDLHIWEGTTETNRMGLVLFDMNNTLFQMPGGKLQGASDRAKNRLILFHSSPSRHGLAWAPGFRSDRRQAAASTGDRRSSPMCATRGGASPRSAFSAGVIG